MLTCEGAGVSLAYDEHGTGRPLLLIHGIAASAAAWLELVKELGSDVRAITYDRRGYGGSGAPEPYERTTIEEQAEDAAALLRAVAGDEAALVCGDGFGALVALDLLKRHGRLVGAAVLSNPPLFGLVPAATAALSAQRDQLERSLLAGGPAAAVATWLDGRLDGAALSAAQASHRAFFADFGGLASWPVTRAQLRAIETPVVVVTGPDTPDLVVTAADALDVLLARSERRTDGDLATAIRSVMPV